MNVRVFEQASTPQEFIAIAGGDARIAESAAWQMWYESGAHPQARDIAYSNMAIAIADTKFAGRA